MDLVVLSAIPYLSQYAPSVFEDAQYSTFEREPSGEGRLAFRGPVVAAFCVSKVFDDPSGKKNCLGRYRK